MGQRDVARDARRGLAYLRPHAAPIGAVVTWTLASSGLSAVEPLLHGAVFDRIVGEGRASFAGLSLLLGLLGAVFVGRQALEVAATLLGWRVRLRVNRDLLAEATAQLHALPLSYHHDRGVGETMTRLDRGITSLMDGLSALAFQLIPAAGYLAFSSYIMFRKSPLLASVAVAFVVPAILLGGLRSAEVVERQRAIMDRWCAIYNRFQQVLTGIKTVKAFAREQEEHAHFIGSVQRTQEQVMKSIRLETGLGATRSICVNAGRLAVLSVGAVLVARGELGVGALVAFLGYIGGLYGPAQTLLSMYETLRKAELGLESVFGVLDAEDAVPDRPGALTPSRLCGEIAFDRVTYRYGKGASSQAALSDVSFNIRAGEFVAIVGPSGAGKSTLAHLILRLHDPTEGVVRIDGHDLRDLSQRALRLQIGIIAQESFLFEDSIEANVRYGALSATSDQVEAALSAAQAESFISKLPEGLGTRVGGGGVVLSGGERQRLAIARTLLKDPSVVILDEPTSQLDVEGERAVHSALERLAAGRTTLLIAHRLGTTLGADRVLVLEEGRLVQDGRPGDLLAREGPYRRMIDAWRRPVSPRTSNATRVRTAAGAL